MAYFEKLNYSLANEDTRIEYDLLPKNTDRVFSISGSGARCIPLIARNPKEIVVVDLAVEQLYLCELRLAAAKALTYEEYLYFTGYRGALVGGNLKGDDRVALFKRLKLSENCQAFWSEHQKDWSPHGFILLGKWENHFQKLGAIFRKGLRMNVRPIFEAHSLDEQLDLYKKHWNTFLFRNFLKLVANEYVFNKFLYKGHFSGSQEDKTEKRAPWLFLDEEFRRLFTTTLVRKNYFLQVLFLGRIYYEEGLPIEATREVFEQTKASNTRVEYIQGNLVDVLRSRPFNFVSLSDTISYLPQDDASNILQTLHKDTPSGSCIVVRSFLRAPQKVNTEGWYLDEKATREAFEADGTGVYQFHIFRKR